MRKQLLILLSTLISIQAYSQIIFEHGYFIDESDQKIECLIKNVDWNNNPKKFEYKLSSDASTQYANIQTVKEFGINGISKYISADVKIDRSSNSIKEMSDVMNPVFEEEQLFLKLLIDGDASLFIYRDGNLSRYFYKVKDSEIKQLVYKKYLSNGRINENITFRQQLLNDIKCPSIALNDIENIDYRKESLIRIFTKYNQCINSDFINFEEINDKDAFNLTLRPGVNLGHLKIENSDSPSRNINFDKKINVRFGIEAEFILPFNKDKWSIITEPTYQYYASTQSKETQSISGGIIVSEVDYQSIELPIGVRHYFYLNNSSKIFTNVSYVFDFAINSSVEYRRSDDLILNSLKVQSRRNIAVGIGYNYNNKFSLETRFQTGREILNENVLWKSRYQTISLILGYTIL